MLNDKYYDEYYFIILNNIVVIMEQQINMSEPNYTIPQIGYCYLHKGSNYNHKFFEEEE